MRITAFVLVLLVASAASPATAQQAAPPENTDLALGRAALAKDPTKAIGYFERVDSRESREWLAVALMMESRSASDDYVDRAFTAAMRSRVESAQAPTRAAIASALRPGDLVIASLVGENDAYAWAFDRDAFVGYQLPPRATLAAAGERARGYAAANDRDGVQRIAEDLAPALLGPAAERLSKVNRLILALDAPLDRLPAEVISQSVPGGIAVVMTTHAALLNTINAPTPAPARRDNHIVAIAALGAALLLLAWYVSRRARRRSPARS